MFELMKKKDTRCVFLKRTLVKFFSCGASVAHLSERSPFTSEAAGSILSENFLNVIRSQCSTHVKRVSQHSAESRGFFSGRSGFLPQGS